ncbi:MAG: carboxypeptidase regulatory-like domain-containing protein [Oscillospiraceae bacterium]|nr:carboxypeptidase regulatory-like domain-containing protein [Oscillospiraceae bacterium]
MHNRYIYIYSAVLLLTSAACLPLVSCGTENTSADAADSDIIEEIPDLKKCGTFVGTVYKKSNGDIIAGVTVTAENVKTQQSYSTVTNLHGSYELTVPEGTYTLQFVADGFYGLCTDEYKVKKGATVETDHPIRLNAVGENPNGETPVGPDIDDTPSDMHSEASESPSDAPEQPDSYVDSNSPYKSFIDGIIACSEYRGFDGKTALDYAQVMDYMLLDMDHDGTDELIVNTGSCEADRSICFYTYRNGTVQLIGYNFSGFHVCGYLRDNDTDQLVTQWAHQGVGGTTWYYYDGDTVRITKETGPVSYEDDASAVLAENCTPIEAKCGYRRDSGWIFQ